MHSLKGDHLLVTFKMERYAKKQLNRFCTIELFFSKVNNLYELERPVYKLGQVCPGEHTLR